MERTHWLTGADGHCRRIALPLKGPLLIGRGPYNHVVLSDARISRQHARIVLGQDGYWVHDLGSSNGTFVNGARVRTHLLQLHDEVAFGPRIFRFSAAEESEQPPDDFGHLETPTLRDLECASRGPTSCPPSTDSTRELPFVDLVRLEDAYDKLGIVYSFLQAISQTNESGELLDVIGAKTRETYPAASSVGIYLLVRENGLADFKLSHFVGDVTVDRPPNYLPKEICGAVASAPKGLLVAPRGGANDRATSMYVPMVAHNVTTGIIHVSANSSSSGFVRTDLELLASMAAPAATMLQNAYNRRDQVQRDRLRNDLELAAQIQRSFLPREVVSVEGAELFAEYRAAYSVGGDFYDVFLVGPTRLGVFIGDISGKGVAGALLMARMSSEMRIPIT